MNLWALGMAHPFVTYSSRSSLLISPLLSSSTAMFNARVHLEYKSRIIVIVIRDLFERQKDKRETKESEKTYKSTPIWHSSHARATMPLCIWQNKKKTVFNPHVLNASCPEPSGSEFSLASLKLSISKKFHLSFGICTFVNIFPTFLSFWFVVFDITKNNETDSLIPKAQEKHDGDPFERCKLPVI